MAKFNIMAFDGGGIKGLITTIILQKLKKQVPDLLEKADMLSGTSTGGIIALGLASGLRVERLRSLYEVEGARIFKRRLLHPLGLTGAKYTNKELKVLLREILGDVKLGDLPQRVLIPAFDLKSDKPPIAWKPKFFHNFGDAEDNGRLAADIALYTSAAPTYFPAYHGYVDGGMVANNPSMAALCQALDPRYEPELKIEDIALLNVGTGLTNKHVLGDSKDFGALQVKTLVDIMLNGTESVPEFQCRVILDERYIKANPEDPDDIEMDDVKKIPELVAIAEQYSVDPVVKWLRENWDK